MHDMTTLDDFEAVLHADAPALILKHSTTCPISAAAYRRVAEYEQQGGGAAPPVWVVRVHESRPVSNAIAERIGVVHKSPQLLLIQGGRCVWNTSHYDITAENIDKALRDRATR